MLDTITPRELELHAAWTLGEAGGIRIIVKSGANLRGANLIQTCLDPENTKTALHIARASRQRGIFGYRTARQTHTQGAGYVPGKTYVANALSWSAETACHPGLYFYATLEELRREYTGPYIRVYIRAGEWVPTAKGAGRCARFRVLNYVE